MIELKLKSWRRFRANVNRSILSRFMHDVGTESEKVFRAGLTGGHSGAKYPNLPNRSSAPGEFPASQFGALIGSIGVRSSAQEVTLGTGVFYAKFLRYGTSKMGRRKMSDNALQEGAENARSSLRRWAEWIR